MKKIATLVVLNFVLLNCLISQNYFCAVYPDQNGNIELFLENYCGAEVQWQARDTASTEWLDITNATTNPFLYTATAQNTIDQEFRARMILVLDTVYSHPFGIKLISSLNNLQVNDYYNGNFIYYTSNDTILGTYFTGQGASWGCVETEVLGANGTSIGSGWQNTMDIIGSDCLESVFAAKVSDDAVLNGLDDWYLPSIGELELILTTLFNSP